MLLHKKIPIQVETSGYDAAEKGLTGVNSKHAAERQNWPNYFNNGVPDVSDYIHLKAKSHDVNGTLR